MLPRGSFLAAMLLAIVGIVGLSPSAAFAQRTTTANLYFIHGLPGNELDVPRDDIDFPNDLPVDVNIGIPGTGTLITRFENVEFGEIGGPLQLNVGSYLVEVRVANLTNPGTGALIVTATVALRARENHSVVLHIRTNGTPALTDYKNDVALLPLTTSRVVFRHDSRNAAVDMSLLPTVPVANGVAAINLTNPQQSAVSNLLPGSYTLTVRPTGQASDLLSPAAAVLNPRNNTAFYLVGSTDRNTLTVITHSFRISLRP